jgi:hypothetical protein
VVKTMALWPTGAIFRLNGVIPVLCPGDYGGGEVARRAIQGVEFGRFQPGCQFAMDALNPRGSTIGMPGGRM